MLIYLLNYCEKFSSHHIKIILFYHFRGPKEDRGVPQKNIQSRTIESDSSNKYGSTQKAYLTVPTIQDVFICYGTVPDYASFRDPKQGTWFIQAFVKTFEEHSHDTEFDGLMKLLQTKLFEISKQHNVHQTMSRESRGPTKNFFLNTGLYNNDNNNDET